MIADSFKPYATNEEVEAVIRRFESCDFAPGEFHHSDHLTVALWYLIESTEEEASERMRAGLLRFLKHHGSLHAYHETITLFWIKRMRHFLAQTDKTRPLVTLANELVAKCSNTRIINVYFSAARLASDEARKTWVEPDLRPLES